MFNGISGVSATGRSVCALIIKSAIASISFAVNAPLHFPISVPGTPLLIVLMIEARSLPMCPFVFDQGGGCCAFERSAVTAGAKVGVEDWAILCEGRE